MRTLWQDTVPDPDSAALEPGRPASLGSTCDVLVVGGGVIGLGVAAMCRRAGFGRVLLCERDERLVSGTSGSAAGFLAPDNPLRSRAPSAAFARTGLDLHRSLDGEWDYGLRDADWHLTGEDADAPAVVPQQALVHPLRLAAAFARHAGDVATGVAVEGMDVDRGRVVRVRTTAGDVAPGAVVWATGTTPDAYAPPGQALVKGHLVATEPAPFRLGHVVTSPRILVLQTPEGRLVAGGTLEPGDLEPVVREPVVATITEEMAALVPGAGDLEVTHRWCCFRPVVGDELPVIDRLPGTDNAWVAAGHFRAGLLMAPATGKAIADWIGTGRAPDTVGDFALER